jgi:hypothetical protein
LQLLQLKAPHSSSFSQNEHASKEKAQVSAFAWFLWSMIQPTQLKLLATTMILVQKILPLRIDASVWECPELCLEQQPLQQSKELQEQKPAVLLVLVSCLSSAQETSISAQWAFASASASWSQ